MPFFSVIIPSFNRGHFIAKTLDSVLRQDFVDYEIIVIDDGSTDNTHEVLLNYGNRIKVYRQENKGAGIARNLGVQKSEGKYIAFLDSDDVWFPWTLGVYHQVIEESEAPAFIGGSAIFFSDEKKIELASRTPVKTQSFPDYFSSSQQSLWLGTCSVVICSDAFYRVDGFVGKKINAEDSDLWLRLGLEKGFVFIDSPVLFGYRQHVNSEISNNDRTFQGICYLITQENQAKYPGGNARKQERLEILTRHVRPVSLACLRQRKVQDAWKLYMSTLKWHFQLGRFKYLAVFPVITITSLFHLSKKS